MAGIDQVTIMTVLVIAAKVIEFAAIVGGFVLLWKIYNNTKK